jgi:signal transduction histidine kinase/CheY-like chemotaxis protein/HAMP domain-containing protein
MVKRLGFKQLIIILFLVTGFIPILFIGWYVMNSTREVLLTNVYDQNKLMFEATEESVEMYFNSYEREVASALVSLNLEEYYEAFYRNDENISSLTLEYQAELFDITNKIGINEFAVTDTTGKVIFGSAPEFKDVDLSSRTYMPAAMNGQMTFSEPYPSPTLGIYQMAYAVPIFDDQSEQLGVLLVDVNFDTLDQVVHARVGDLGETGDAYLVNADGNLQTNTTIGEYSEDSRFVQFIDSYAASKLRSPLLQNKNEYVTTETFVDYAGKDVIGTLGVINAGNVEFGLVVKVEEQEALAYVQDLILALGSMIILVLLVEIVAAYLVIRRIMNPITTLETTFDDIATGEIDLDFRMSVATNDEIGHMSDSFNQFMVKLKEMMDETNFQNWLKTAQNELNTIVRDEDNYQILTNNTLSYICKYLDLPIGAFYLVEGDELKLSSTYAYKNRKELLGTVKKGEGIVGQCLIEKTPFILNDLPDDYLLVQSGLGSVKPKNLCVLPCMHEEDVLGIIEVGSLKPMDEETMNLLTLLSDSIATAMHSTQLRSEMRILLERTITQSEEMKQQQEELRQINEELEEQARALRDSESQLQQQQEELRVSNEELEERTKQLEIQKNVVDEKNDDLLKKQAEIIEKAEALELSNTYKSEFLANMSHELRTPLNSILVLSNLLADRNNESPLSDKEKEFAKTINSSGADLLKLINDILDLSKVEAGKLDIHHDDIMLEDLAVESQNLFSPLAEAKGIEFVTHVDENAGKLINSDKTRIQQIVKNLVSNAIKFTDVGTVQLNVRKPTPFECDSLNLIIEDHIAFEVTDTGIGIPEEKQQLIFEAFRQADGTTSRKFGGTGLGLTISRELAALLGGEIILESQYGKGSKFVLILPVIAPKEAIPVSHVPKPVVTKPLELKDAAVTINDLTVEESINRLLIIEDDLTFATILKELATEKGFETTIATTAGDALDLVDVFKPTAIILDLGLPDMDGRELATKFEKLDVTKNVPIHVISGRDAETSMPTSVIGFLKKPVDIKSIYLTLSKIEKVTKSDNPLLLVIGECGNEDFDHFSKLGQLEVEKVLTVKAGLSHLNQNLAGIIILDQILLKKEEKDFERLFKEFGQIPTIIYSENELSKDELDELSKFSDNIILKSSKTTERLKDEVSLFLHGMKDNETSELKFNENAVKPLDDEIFIGKKVLVVDDDERNVFALSHLLQKYGFEVDVCEDGEESIEFFKKQKETDLVLMDIMMPKVDGYEAIREIRKLDNGKDVPIIVLTAKAMKENRDKCLKAGANDYLTKPIDVEKLLSLLQVWVTINV